MTLPDFGIIGATTKRNAPAVLDIPRGVTQEVSAPMCSKSIPNSTTETIPFGYCQCGCGQRTRVADRSHAKYGHIKGLPLKFVRGHNSVGNDAPYQSANPSGLCMCGCGQKTSVATHTIRSEGLIKGQPMRYVKGHSRKGLVSAGPSPEWDEEIHCFRIPLSGVVGEGKYALVDREDVHLVASGRWYVLRGANTEYASGRAQVDRGDRRVVQMHRLLMRAPHDLLIDHVNGNGLDNRRANLRFADKSQNGANRLLSTSTGTSEYLGVRWHSLVHKWEARITVRGESRSLGFFVDEVEAARARDAAAKEAFGEFATLNLVGAEND